jgi:hypothetical protein
MDGHCLTTTFRRRALYTWFCDCVVVSTILLWRFWQRDTTVIRPSVGSAMHASHPVPPTAGKRNADTPVNSAPRRSLNKPSASRRKSLLACIPEGLFSSVKESSSQHLYRDLMPNVIESKHKSLPHLRHSLTAYNSGALELHNSRQLSLVFRYMLRGLLGLVSSRENEGSTRLAHCTHRTAVRGATLGGIPRRTRRHFCILLGHMKPQYLCFSIYYSDSTFTT